MRCWAALPLRISAAEGLRSLCCLLACGLGFLAASVEAHGVNPPPEKNVLIFFSFNDRQAFTSLEPLKAQIQARAHAPVSFHVEYLDASQLGTESYQKSVLQSIASAYGGKKIDLVVTAAYPALRFAIDHRPQCFPVRPSSS